MPQPRGAITPEVFVTRLHLRYDGASSRTTCAFARPRDRSNFQGRYVLRHPWRGAPRCEAARAYLARPAAAVRAGGAEPGAADPLAGRADPRQDGGGRPVLHASRPEPRPPRVVGEALAGLRAYGGR